MAKTTGFTLAQAELCADIAENQGWTAEIRHKPDGTILLVVSADWTPLHPQIYSSRDSFVQHLARLGFKLV